MKWMAEAKKYIGEKEYKAGDNPFIVGLWKDIKRSGIKTQSVPWCAAFVGAMLERAGIRSSRFESAKSYLQWGKQIPEPVTGCIVVFSREGGGHVGFVVGQDKAGNLLVLGGNQGDSVSVKEFPRTRVTGYRWPIDIIQPVPVLPVLDSVDFSRGEA